MYPVPGICPVCGDELSVTRLHCGRCDTTLEGLFTLGRFHYLTREQQQFIAIFIKCRGKIRDVEGELGISYPTVVSRLDDVIAALGFAEPVRETRPVEPPAVQAQPEVRRTVLDELAKGHITSEEALLLLRGQDLAPEVEAPVPPAPPAAPAAPAIPAAPAAPAAPATRVAAPKAPNSDE